MEELKQLQYEKPQEKPVWKFKKTRVSEEEQDDIDIEDLSAEEMAAYGMWTRKFEREEARWMKKEDALKDFNSEIAQTINVKLSRCNNTGLKDCTRKLWLHWLWPCNRVM